MKPLNHLRLPRTPRRVYHRCAALLVSFGAVLTGGPAAAQGPLPIVVLHRDGTATQALLAGLSGGELRVFDAERRLTTLDPDAAAVLTLSPDAALATAPRETGVLGLTDGQRLAGVWAGAADGGESLRWAHPQLGTVVVPLDQVAGWTTAGVTAPPEADPAGGDVVALARGERLSGFLYLPDPADSSADLSMLLLAPADAPDDPAVPVPTASVVAVTLANPPAAVETGSTPARVTLHDGSRLRARALSLGAESVAFEAEVAGQRLRVEQPATAVRRVVLTAAGRDAHDLADLPAQTPAPLVAEAALWGPGVAGAAATPDGYRLAAPAQLRLALPADAVIVVGRVRLDLPAGLSTQRAAWAGCTLRIDGTPRVELNLDAQQPEARFRVAVPAGATQLVFTLDPGPRGPVLDTVRIEDAVVLTAAP